MCYGRFMSSNKRMMRTYSKYEDELRQFNDAQSIRRGKKKDGNPPSFFKDLFDYKQPRRNNRGCGDIKWIIPLTGEIQTIHCDQVSTAFQHMRAPKGKQYALRSDRRDLADEAA